MTKRSRSSSPPAPHAELPDASTLSTFATRGWVCVRSFLSPSELQLLQRESSACYQAAGADATQAAAVVTAQGCVLDVMATCPIRDDDPARVDKNCYLDARAQQLEETAACQSLDDRNVFASLLFNRLPKVITHLLADAEATETVGTYFFNEHYVVKPPHSHVEFRWHRDDDEQLAMCLHRASIRPYVSAWCALDDVTEVNGALQFVSRDEDVAADEFEKCASSPVVAKAGDVLFFLSDVWHCSSSNESGAPRRAFYAQYSREEITAGPNDPLPLSFAIPCMDGSKKTKRKRYKAE